MMIEIQEHLDDIVGWDSNLYDPIEISNGNLKIRCSHLRLYGKHPLCKILGNYLENRDMHLIFYNVFSSVRTIKPYIQERRDDHAEWLAEVSITDIVLEGIPPVRFKRYDVSEFGHRYPTHELQCDSCILEWEIVAERMSLFVDESPSVHPLKLFKD